MRGFVFFFSNIFMGMESAEAHTPTFGEKAVGLTFNPSGMVGVDVLKQDFAKVIDLLHNLRNDANASPEVKRLCSIAITEAQGAQMWAVKAVTWKD